MVAVIPKNKKGHTLTRENPLISRNLLDTAQQRLVVFAFFTLIQSFKIYDLIILKNSNSQNKLESPQVISTLFLISFHDNKLNFLFKYLIIDTLFIWFVPFLNIPFLNFNRVVTLIQVTLMVLLDLGIANEVHIPVVSFAFSALMKFMHINQKEMTLLGDIVDKNEVLDHSQYFKGKKIIKFLPDSLVELNPFGGNWCINSELIPVPIRFNTSSKSIDFLQLKYISLEDENSVQMLNYTGKSLKKLIKNGARTYYNEVAGQDNIFYVDLPLLNSGFYQLNQVIDNESMNLKLLNKNIIIPQCPSAKLIGTSKDLSQICLNDEVKEDDVLINVVGLPPLTVTYNEEVNGVVKSSPKRQVIPSNFESPLLNSRKYTTKDISTLSSWASLRSINLPILQNQKLDKAGDYIYTINSIEDAFGNKVLYEEPSFDNGLSFKFTTHNIPIGKLVDHAASRPLLEGGSKKLNIQLGGIPCQKCDSPYTATINHYNENNNFINSFNQTFDLSNSRDLSIVVTEPGFYELERFESRFCHTSNPTKVYIPFVDKPHVEITAESLVDACVGTTGFTFGFNVTGGSPPFRLEYKVNRLKDRKEVSIPQIKRIEAKSNVFEHEYKPPTEGNYSVEFIKMKDQFYEEKFEKNKYKYVTYFKQKSKANIKKASANICHGNSETFPVVFEGKAPFSINYNLVKNGQVIKSFEQENIMSDEYLITTPKLSTGGDYSIELVDAKDASLCSVELQTREINFNVRDSVPKMSFANPQRTLIVEGRLQTVPVKFENLKGATVELTYKLVKSDGRETSHTIKNFSPSQGFKISEKGKYILTEFRDSGCLGLLSGGSVEVDYYPKPTIEATTKSAAPVCINNSQKLKFKLTGRAPFTVAYSIQFPNKRTEERFVPVQGNEFVLDAITSSSGAYKYEIIGLYDALYTDEVVELLEKSGSYKFDKIGIEHKVWETPLATFSNITTGKFINNNQNVFIQTCYSNLKDNNLLEPISIKLFGQPPFNVKMSINSKDKKFQKMFKLSNVESDSIDSYDIYQKFKLDIDNYVISLLEVEDGHGCVNKDLAEQSNSVILKVNDIPKIKRHINKFTEHNKISVLNFAKQKVNKGQHYDDYYCVGDHIFFHLEGVLPFNVGYKFNGEAHTINDLKVPNFKRLATKPGELVIDTISDFSAKSCIVDLSSNAERIKIYDLPSVEISHGNAIEEDIHAGDQAELSFTFKGVPPFKLTYTRTTTDDGYDTKRKRKGKKYGDKIVETEVVENIQGYEYNFWTSLEGSYEAIELEDSRCKVKNYL